MLSRVKGLAEIALPARDLETMTHFYSEIVGLEVMRRSEDVVFFRIAEGSQDTQMLVVFAASVSRIR